MIDKIYKNKMNEISKEIKEKLQMNAKSIINYKENHDSTMDSPFININQNMSKITICFTGKWNDTYQLSHELLHLFFAENNNFNMNTDTTWVEEIVCEAFSIYCLSIYENANLYDLKATSTWFGMWSQDFYLKAVALCEKDMIGDISLEELNTKLSNHKSNEILHFIHPTVLEVKNIIEEDFDQLLLFSKFPSHSKRFRLTKEYSKCNKIAEIIYNFQESLK